MKKSTANISTLVAVGGALAAFPAAALELGEVKVNSSLGQPLRASIAYALAPNETLADTCVSVQGGRMHGTTPGVGAASVSVANGVISITGNAAIREPLVTMRLNVRCPYAGKISRDYTMFIDPVFIAEQISLAQTSVAPQVAPQTVAAPAAKTRRVVRDEPVVGGTRYQVAAGETLGDIAQRIVDRPVGLWPAVEGIVAANPDAFLNGDANQLIAGSWLLIPDFGSSTPLTVAAAAPAAATFQETPANDLGESSVYTGMTADQAVVPTDMVAAPPELIEVPDPTAALEAAAVIEAADSAEAVEIAAEAEIIEVVDIPDTELPAPEVSATTPNVATASIRPTRVEESSTNWLAWLGGAGIAIIALLLFFGRLVRNRFGSSPIGALDQQDRRKSDSSPTLDVVSEMEVSAEAEVTIDELDETQENLALDADLIIGSGLQESSEVDVAQDFGFAATTQLDHEFPEEMTSNATAGSETDIIPPLNIEVQSILESEVMPDEEKVAAAEEDQDDDDYDMSVIIDATKMPDPEDATLRDLEAVQVETGDETLVTGDYTVSSEVDYTVLEQDYEDEFSATQALNEEIARAAEELTQSMADNGDISLASVAALDITAEMRANNDDDVEIDEDEVTAKFKTDSGA